MIPGRAPRPGPRAEPLPRSLAWRLPLAFALLALTMFGLLVSSWQSYDEMRAAQAERDAADLTLAELATLETAFLPRAGRALCAATGASVSTQRDLAPALWPAPLDRMQTLLADQPEALRRLAALRADLQAWEERHEQPLREACRAGRPLGTGPVLALAQATVPLRDGILQQLRALRSAEQGRLQQREADLATRGQAAGSWFTLLAVVAGLLSLFTVIAVQGATRRLLASNQRLLQEAADREAAEQQLSTSERRQRMVLAHLPDAVMAFDATGRVLWVNPAAEQMFGAPADALVGEPLWDRIPALEKELAWPETQPELGSAAPAAPWRARRDRVMARRVGEPRETFPVELALVQTRTAGERLGVAIARDLSEAERVDRMKHEFVSVVSHELRTPLTSIRGSLSMLVDGMAGELEPPAARLVGLAHANSERLVTLVNDILDYEKLAAGQMRMVLAPLDLVRAAEQALEAIEGYAHQHGVQVRLNAPPEPPWVEADAGRLQQVLANLLSNAVKFSPPGSVVQVNLACQRGEARVWVIDAGEGVPASFRDRLFQPFAQADGTSTRRQGGTGLGLAVSQALMQQMGGRIGLADGEPGKGAVFWLALPLVGAAAP